VQFIAAKVAFAGRCTTPPARRNVDPQSIQRVSLPLVLGVAVRVDERAEAARLIENVTAPGLMKERSRMIDSPTLPVASVLPLAGRCPMFSQLGERPRSLNVKNRKSHATPICAEPVVLCAGRSGWSDVGAARTGTKFEGEWQSRRPSDLRDSVDQLVPVPYHDLRVAEHEQMIDRARAAGPP
jgi:hypothetical protein